MGRARNLLATQSKWLIFVEGQCWSSLRLEVKSPANRRLLTRISIAQHIRSRVSCKQQFHTVTKVAISCYLLVLLLLLFLQLVIYSFFPYGAIALEFTGYVSLFSLVVKSSLRVYPELNQTDSKATVSSTISKFKHQKALASYEPRNSVLSQQPDKSSSSTIKDNHYQTSLSLSLPWPHM